MRQSRVLQHPQGAIALRSDLRAGDLGRVVLMHGLLYAREQGFDASFEAYVAEPLARFAIARSPRERIWLAEQRERLVGCVAIVAASPAIAQLRWFLVDPSTRGAGLGRALLEESIAFARGAGYAEIHLWTVSALAAAAKLYRAAGFEQVEERPGRCWGVDVIEERYALALPARSD